MSVDSAKIQIDRHIEALNRIMNDSSWVPLDKEKLVEYSIASFESLPAVQSFFTDAIKIRNEESSESSRSRKKKTFKELKKGIV